MKNKNDDGYGYQKIRIDNKDFMKLKVLKILQKIYQKKDYQRRKDMNLFMVNCGMNIQKAAKIVMQMRKKEATFGNISK